MRFTTLLLFVVATTATVGAQDFPEMSLKKAERWAQETGLTSFRIHRLWRVASHFADPDNDDDSQIEDVVALQPRSGYVPSSRILLVTSEGEHDCLTLTVFEIILGNPLRKIWTEDQTPDGEGFCATAAGKARVTAATEHEISVGIPLEKEPNGQQMTVYSYRWTGEDYRLVGKTRVLFENVKRAATAK